MEPTTDHGACTRTHLSSVRGQGRQEELSYKIHVKVKGSSRNQRVEKKKILASFYSWIQPGTLLLVSKGHDEEVKETVGDGSACKVLSIPVRRRQVFSGTFL